ncbi:MAG TPA: sulfatase/phosphatase domain-containing protein, partial [Herpetosiphonaceae bacterium]
DWACVPPEDRLPMDATSLTGLLAGSPSARRIVFSEYHVEKVRAPCFMVRAGSYKYIYIHGHGSQLFDLEADPGEWHSVAGQPALRAVEEELHARMLQQFDPDRLAADGVLSVRRREMLRQAMARNNTHWDYFVYIDATQQYVR